MSSGVSVRVLGRVVEVHLAAAGGEPVLSAEAVLADGPLLGGLVGDRYREGTGCGSDDARLRDVVTAGVDLDALVGRGGCGDGAALGVLAVGDDVVVATADHHAHRRDGSR